MPKISRLCWQLTWLAALLFGLDLWGVVTHQAWVHALDTTVSQAIRQPVSTSLTKLVTAITTTGNPHGTFWTTVLLAAGLLIFRRYQGACFLVVNVVVFAVLGNPLVKHLVQRARPAVHQLVHETSYSFPSGHAITVMVLWGSVIILLATTLPHHPHWRRLLIGLASIWIIVMGVSRVFVGVHYPTDVLAGWLLGFCCLTLSQWLFTLRK